MGDLVRVCKTLPLLLFPLAAVQTAAAQQWQTYSYPADGFSISAPGEPVATMEKVEGSVGTVQMHNYLLDMGTAALYASTSEDAIQPNADPDEALKGAEKGAVSDFKGRLVSERKIALGSYPGVEMEADSDSAHFTARIYIVRSRLYLTLVVSAPGRPYPDATRFLDSFRLLPAVSN